MDWLLAPIDSMRGHEIGMFASWHARLMIAAWFVLFPFGILAARFFKILPGQDWPNQIDNKTWWYGHQTLQYSGGLAILCSLWLIWNVQYSEIFWSLHRILGWTAIILCAIQFITGLTRGSKGGPTDTKTESGSGDHYYMSRRRRIFEHVHKSVGYLALILASFSTITGLWTVNAPRWIWIFIMFWWLLLLIVFAVLQRKGLAIDTYQAIWGPSSDHPGNQMKPIGWGIRRR